MSDFVRSFPTVQPVDQLELLSQRSRAECYDVSDELMYTQSLCALIELNARACHPLSFAIKGGRTTTSPWYAIAPRILIAGAYYYKHNSPKVAECLGVITYMNEHCACLDHMRAHVHELMRNLAILTHLLQASTTFNYCWKSVSASVWNGASIPAQLIPRTEAAMAVMGNDKSEQLNFPLARVVFSATDARSRGLYSMAFQAYKVAIQVHGWKDHASADSFIATHASYTDMPSTPPVLQPLPIARGISPLSVATPFRVVA